MLIQDSKLNAQYKDDASSDSRVASAWGTSVTGAVRDFDETAVGSTLNTLVAGNNGYINGFTIFISNNANATTNRNTAIRFRLGTSGTRAILVPRILCGAAGTYAAAGFKIPLKVRYVTNALSISIDAIRSTSGNFNVIATTNNTREFDRLGTYAIALGGDINTYTGEALTLGTTSRGSWVSLGTLSRDIWAFIPNIQVASSDTAFANSYKVLDIAIGDGSNKKIIAADYGIMHNTNEIQRSVLVEPIYTYLKAGTEVFIRGQSNAGTSPMQANLIGIGG